MQGEEGWISNAESSNCGVGILPALNIKSALNLRFAFNVRQDA
ncbi:hypothetical protein NIES2104_22870 [Leptolyngbya sp. NIES-2104]|nr:hypothetical protein NIES2104_22870 [Leptolyngbya sp. NIES-2104]